MKESSQDKPAEASGKEHEAEETALRWKGAYKPQWGVWILVQVWILVHVQLEVIGEYQAGK